MNSTNNPTTTMKYTIFISVLLLLFGGCQKCKKDPAPDPCLGYKPMSADFKIIETLRQPNGINGAENGIWVEKLEMDTILAGASVSFEANQDLDAYEWRVGGDSRTWDTKKFSLSFFALSADAIGMPVSINITLKGKRTKTEKDSICNKNPKYEEIITKTLVVMPRYSRPAFAGEYEGYSSDKPTEKYVVQIKHTPPKQGEETYNQSGKYELYFYNFNNGCKPIKGDQRWWNSFDETSYNGGTFNSGFIYDVNYNCNIGNAIFFLNKAKDSLTINYANVTIISGVSNNGNKVTFKGKKIK